MKTYKIIVFKGNSYLSNSLFNYYGILILGLIPSIFSLNQLKKKYFCSTSVNRLINHSFLHKHFLIRKPSIIKGKVVRNQER